MYSSLKQPYVVVFAYPHDSTRVSATIHALTSLADFIKSEYEIEQAFQVVDGAQDNRPFATLLAEFLNVYTKVRACVDPLCILLLWEAIRKPSATTLEIIKCAAPGDYPVLEPFAIRAFEYAASPRPVRGAIFLAVDGIPLSDAALWGGCIGTYPAAVAVERTGYRQSMFHECLHIFGVSEGYKEETKVTLPGCQSCWMQWQATRGCGLCSLHQQELRTFMSVLGAV